MITHLLKQAPGCPCCMGRMSLRGVEERGRSFARLNNADRALARQRFEIPPSGRVRLDGGTIVDPKTGDLLNGTSILVEQGRIVSIEARTVADSTAQRIDVRGKFVVPGYNDMHTHVLEVAEPSGALALMLAEGVTGCRQMSGSPKLLHERTSRTLPLSKLAPEILQLPGDVLTPLNASSIEAVREEIRKQQRAGADFIKSGLMSPSVFDAALREARRCGIPILGHLQEGFDAAAAARGGFRSIEHLGPGATLWTSCSSIEEELNQSASSPKFNMTLFKLPFVRALFLHLFQTILINPAAFARPAHVARLRRALETYDDQKCQVLIESFLAAQTWHVPTLVRLRSSELADSPEYQISPYLKYIPLDKFKKWRKVTSRFSKLPVAMRETYAMAYSQQLKLTKRFADAGVRMMTGTDGGWLAGPGLTLQEEFVELQKAGLTPLQILRMSTSNAAEYMGRLSTMGSIAPGCDANIVILDVNPLEKVENFSRIAAVVRAGFYYSRGDLNALVDRVARGRGYLRS